MTEGGHNGAWYCSQTEERKTCPAQGCPKGYCEREHGWVPGMPEPDHYARPQPPAPQDDPQSRVLTGAMAFPTKSDAGEAVGEPAASALPASGAVGDDLVKAAEDAVFGWLSVEEQADFSTFMAAHDAPIIAERDAALAKLAAAEAAFKRFGYHTAGCSMPAGCNCGFDEIRAAIPIAQAPRIAERDAKLAAAEAREESLLAALDPDKTKAAYIGEFYWTEDEMDEGAIFQRKLTVPWPTIKEIMAAIKARAALATEKPE